MKGRIRGRRTWWALFAVAVVLTVLVVAISRTSTAGPARALRRDLAARAAARFPRPVQVEPPVPGTFGQGAAEPWDSLAALEASSTDMELCRAVREGEQPFASLSPSCRRELQGAAAAVDALLAATHAAEAGPPPGLGTLDGPTPPSRPRGWSTLPYAGKLGALRIRQLLAEEDLSAAVKVCVDLQALARDASWGTGLAGRLPALAVEEVAFRPCAAALDWASPEVKRGASVALARVEQGTPSLAVVMREYALRARTQAFAPYLGRVDGLPEQVAAWARDNAPVDRTDWRFTLALGDAWHRVDARLAAAVQASALPMPERAERLDVIAAGKRPWLNPQATFSLPQLGRAARSDARARAQLRLLRGAVAADLFRDERGRWPTGAELTAALGSGDALDVEAHGDSATVVDPGVPRGELAVSVRVDAPLR